MKFCCGVVGLVWMLASAGVMAADQLFGEAASGVPAMVEKCPMHDAHHSALHKHDAPCPVGGDKVAMHEKCELHVNKAGKGKAGEPCPLPHDAKRGSKPAEGCDPASHGRKSAR